MSNLSDRLLKYIRQNPGKLRAAIKKKFYAEEPHPHPNTTAANLKALIGEGLVVEGFFVTDAWKKSKLKTYILITTDFRGKKVRGDWAVSAEGPEGVLTYQQILVRDIQKALRSGPYREHLFLESVEIVLGAEFDIIIVVMADDVYPIGDFVTGFLRTQRDVVNTKTITVWPSKSNPPAPAPDFQA
ncbi:hypothetical protein [Paludisphaera mucosa]|uniref:Uncharacterized protein n=1 Tax=Paludisphaera mucosa TaxID=3030827 RepID=A0ABT6F550_9BACT|nr:hypothetical protein [Paludisphaera mucosa]MDG3002703.1 hypothetical protein [Paludisphaera mucosa]